MTVPVASVEHGRIFAGGSSAYRERLLYCKDQILGRRINNVLDVGCQNGRFLSLLPDEIRKFGVDITISPELSKSIRFANVDLNAGLPFKSEQFDAIFSGEVIEHLLDTESFIRECHRTLKKGGLFVLTTPNLLYWQNVVEFVLGNQFYYVDYRQGQEGHVRYFVPKTLSQVLTRQGFAIERLTTLGDIGARRWSLKVLTAFFRTFVPLRNLIIVVSARKL
jgi:SAM-dependent methyltransferase